MIRFRPRPLEAVRALALLAVAAALSSAQAGCSSAESRAAAAPWDMAEGGYAPAAEKSGAEDEAPPAPAQSPAPGGAADEDVLDARLTDGDDLAFGQQLAQAGGGANGQGAAGGQGGQGAGANGQGGAGGQAGQGAGGGQPPPPAGQPPAGPLLIYEATLTLGVYEVSAVLRTVVELGRELGGFLSRQTDDSVTIRVPARRFHDAIGRLEGLGDVVHRDVRTQDVGEEYRDLQIRLRNAEAIRARLELLLARADEVEDALKVEAELGRVTETIERYKGRLRSLADRVAYSTITVRCAPRPDDQADRPEAFRLPFRWLDELGLRSLLDLSAAQ